MELINSTPLLAQSVPLQIRRNGFILLILVKGTFTVRRDGRLRLADEPQPILFGDEYHDPEQGGSVRFESDLVPFKPKADILLAGHAYAPGGRAIPHLETSVQVGSRQQTVVIFGDRYWDPVGNHNYMTPTQPFTTLPLVYERAFGGMDTLNGAVYAANPVGRGFRAKRPPDDQPFPLPNLERPDQLIQTWQDRPLPAGFGVIGKSWQPRIAYLGTYDESWEQEQSPGPPRDFRSDYFNAAPPERQVAGYLRGDEAIQLINVTPDGRLQCQLPGLQIQASVTITEKDADGHPVGATRTETPNLHLDTLGLLPDQRQVCLVWRGHCRVSELSAQEVDQIVITAKRNG